MTEKVPLTESREGKEDAKEKPVTTVPIMILLGLCLWALIQFFLFQRNCYSPSAPQSSPRTMNRNHTKGNHSVQLLDHDDNLLHCWRTSTLGERATYDILITGCGYSATGFFSQTFTAAGYPVGHEKLKKYGSSFWQAAGRKHKLSPFLFQHIFLLVRHPLKVILSQYGTKWNFVYKDVDVKNESIMMNAQAFEEMKAEFKTLEWWVSYTLLAENIAECFVRTEDVSSEMFSQMCLRAELPDCQHKNWSQIVQQKVGYNTHKKKNSTITWQELQKKVSLENEQLILDHARRVCRRYYEYEDC